VYAIVSISQNTERRSAALVGTIVALTAAFAVRLADFVIFFFVDLLTCDFMDFSDIWTGKSDFTVARGVDLIAELLGTVSGSGNCVVDFGS
jgi:hypothetical protein